MRTPSYRDTPTNFPILDGMMAGSGTAAHSSDGRVIVKGLEQFIGRELPNRDAQLGRYTRTDGLVDCPFLHYRFAASEDVGRAVEAAQSRVSVCVFYRLTTESDRSWLREGYRFLDWETSDEEALYDAYIREGLLAIDTMFGETAHRYVRFDVFE